MSTSCISDRKNGPRIERIDLVVSFVFGIVLLVSGVSHWANPYRFLGSVYAYGLVGEDTGKLVAMFLPLLQMIVGISLIARICHDGAHLIALVMFACFVAVQSAAVFKGLDISCGCFGPYHESAVGFASLSFVSSLLFMAIVRTGLRWRSLDAL